MTWRNFCTVFSLFLYLFITTCCPLVSDCWSYYSAVACLEWYIRDFLVVLIVLCALDETETNRQTEREGGRERERDKRRHSERHFESLNTMHYVLWFCRPTTLTPHSTAVWLYYRRTFYNVSSRLLFRMRTEFSPFSSASISSKWGRLGGIGETEWL